MRQQARLLLQPFILIVFTCAHGQVHVHGETSTHMQTHPRVPSVQWRTMRPMEKFKRSRPTGEFAHTRYNPHLVSRSSGSAAGCFSLSMRKTQGFTSCTREWKSMLGSGDTGVERPPPSPAVFFPCNSREFLPPLSLVMPATDIQTTPKTVEFFVPSSLRVSVFHYFCQMLFCKCPQTPEVRMSWPSR